MSRNQSTNRDYGGNAVIHAQLDPVVTDPAPADRKPWAPWLNTARNEFCWYDDDGTVHCISPTAGQVAGQPDCEIPTTTYLLLQPTVPVETVFGENFEYVFIDCGDLTADLDLTGWQPTVSGALVEFRFRKSDTSAHKIIYTDATGITYNFVDRYGEFITLVWDSVAGDISVA